MRTLTIPEALIEKYSDQKPLYRRVYLIVRDFVTNGSAAEIDKLTEEGVAAALQISRTPVRTALTQLRDEHILANVTRTNIGIPQVTEKRAGRSFGRQCPSGIQGGLSGRKQKAFLRCDRRALADL